MRSLQGLGVNRRLAYDANGERILVREVNLSPAVYTLTLRDLGGKVLREVTYTPSTGSWAWRKDYVWRDGHLLASVLASEGLRHAHLDHLGSPRLLTNRCGERLASWQLWPFGLDPQGQAGGGGQHPERMRFTGHERDLHVADRAGDDLDYMHARTYTPYLGRFTSVDPGRDNDLRAPQSWNLYAYVRGNPLVNVDPDGRAANWLLGALIGGGAEYLVQCVENLAAGQGMGSFANVDGRKIAASAGIGAATSGLSAVKVAGKGLSLLTRTLIGAAGNLGEAQAHASIEGEDLSPEATGVFLGTGGGAEVGGVVGQKVARKLAPTAVRKLEREARRLANIAEDGRPRAAQQERAARAADRAAGYGAGWKARAIGEVLRKATDETIEKTERP